ncbi:MAG: hypothetical protein IKL89_07365 [Clostridia bacterium]|nr:hypothetical protein [Clostridia bacterium]
MPEIRIQPGFIVLMAVFVLVCEDGLLLCGLAALLLHEAGHVIALYITGGGVRRVSFSLFGGLIEPRYPLRLSPAGETAVCLAGPGANLLAAPLFALAGHRTEWGYVLAGLNVAAGVFNLLPVSGLDGGRALGFALAGWPRAEGLCARLTLYFGLAAFVPGLLLLLSAYRNPTLLVFSLWATFRALRGNSSCESGQKRV